MPASITSVRVDYLANLSCQPDRSKWFLNEFHLRIQHAIMNNRFVSVTRHEEHFYFRTQDAEPFRNLFATRLSHNDIGE